MRILARRRDDRSDDTRASVGTGPHPSQADAGLRGIADCRRDLPGTGSGDASHFLAQRWIVRRTRRGDRANQGKRSRDSYGRANGAKFSGASLWNRHADAALRGTTGRDKDANSGYEKNDGWVAGAGKICGEDG